MNRKRLTAMVLSGVLAASMAVTGTAAEDQVTITFSLWDEIQSVVYQELIDNFEEQNPNIHERCSSHHGISTGQNLMHPQVQTRQQMYSL